MKAVLTTVEVLDRLARLGLSASIVSLDNDVREGFLPPRERVPNPAGRGRTSLWEPWMMQRAERLYRLRKKRGANGKPLVYGDVLRLLLFWADGWGWSQRLRDVALIGFDKALASVRAPIGRHLSNAPTRAGVEVALDVAIDDREVSPVERYAIGMLTIGAPLQGGSLSPVFTEAHKAGLIPEWYPHVLASLDKGLAAQAVPGFRMVMRAAIAAIDDSIARDGIGQARTFCIGVRRALRRAYVASGNGHAKTNLFTMFGRNQRELERDFREQRAPQRITPAQCLALYIALDIAVFTVVEEACVIACSAFPFLQRILAPSLSTHGNASIVARLFQPPTK